MPVPGGVRSRGCTSYGSGGVRVMDARKAIKRLYRFDPASDSMTERDPVRQEKVIRRFVFDRYGMLEETFTFGARPGPSGTRTVLPGLPSGRAGSMGLSGKFSRLNKMALPRPHGGATARSSACTS